MTPTQKDIEWAQLQIDAHDPTRLALRVMRWDEGGPCPPDVADAAQRLVDSGHAWKFSNSLAERIVRLRELEIIGLARTSYRPGAIAQKYHTKTTRKLVATLVSVAAVFVVVSVARGEEAYVGDQSHRRVKEYDANGSPVYVWDKPPEPKPQAPNVSVRNSVTIIEEHNNRDDRRTGKVLHVRPRGQP